MTAHLAGEEGDNTGPHTGWRGGLTGAPKFEIQPVNAKTITVCLSDLHTSENTMVDLQKRGIFFLVTTKP